MKNYLLLSAVVMGAFFCFAGSANAVTWTTFDYPGAILTVICDIDGSRTVGGYGLKGAPVYPSFLHEGTTWTTLDLPGPVTGISGGNIVGNYSSSIDGSFLYKEGSYAPLNFPGVSRTVINGIDGSNIVGYANGHGVIYNLDSQTWATLDFPGASGTTIADIDGGNIVGNYYDVSGHGHSFLYNGTDWITLDLPGFISGISGRNIVGNYFDIPLRSQCGFLYDGTSLTTLNFPGAGGTTIYGIDGDKIVGVYLGSDNNKHGFIATIPEPCTILLVGMGSFLLRRRSKK